MYADKKFMGVALWHQLGAFNTYFTNLSIYSDAVPTDIDYTNNGFVFANHTSSLIGTVSLGANAWVLNNPSANKWRFSLSTAPRTGTCSIAGTATYGVLWSSTATPHYTLIGSVGTDADATIRLNTLSFAPSDQILFNYFNFIVNRGAI